MHLVALQQDDGGAEAGSAFGNPFELAEHLVDVGFAVMARTGIACRMYTRLAVERINLKSRVVAETVVAVMLLDIQRLHAGIAFDSGCCFRDILMTTDVGQSKHLIYITQHLAQLLQFVRIIGRKDNLLHFPDNHIINYELHELNLWIYEYNSRNS